MDWSWLANIAPELVLAALLAVLLGLFIKYTADKASPLLHEFIESGETTRQAFAEINKQSSALIDRIERQSQREIENLRTELDTEKIARGDLERRVLESQKELTSLRDELAAVKRDRADVAADRDRLDRRVKDLEREVSVLQDKLVKANGKTAKPRRVTPAKL